MQINLLEQKIVMVKQNLELFLPMTPILINFKTSYIMIDIGTRELAAKKLVPASNNMIMLLLT
jgi:hypothetical protein